MATKTNSEAVFGTHGTGQRPWSWHVARIAGFNFCLCAHSLFPRSRFCFLPVLTRAIAHWSSSAGTSFCDLHSLQTMTNRLTQVKCVMNSRTTVDRRKQAERRMVWWIKDGPRCRQLIAASTDSAGRNAAQREFSSGDDWNRRNWNWNGNWNGEMAKPECRMNEAVKNDDALNAAAHRQEDASPDDLIAATSGFLDNKKFLEKISRRKLLTRHLTAVHW